MAIHIGEKIKARAKELRIGPTELAGLINTSKQNVYAIYRRKTVDTELLKKISIALHADFFDVYYDKQWLKTFNEGQATYGTKKTHKTNLPNSESEEITRLKKELQELKEKYELLAKLFALTEEKTAPKRKK